MARGRVPRTVQRGGRDLCLVVAHASGCARETNHVERTLTMRGYYGRSQPTFEPTWGQMRNGGGVRGGARSVRTIGPSAIKTGAQFRGMKALDWMAAKFKSWVELVETDGLEAAQAIPGFNDEALKGERAGQRSIRLHIAWRAIYTIDTDESGEEVVRLLTVIEVSKHEY